MGTRLRFYAYLVKNIKLTSSSVFIMPVKQLQCGKMNVITVTHLFVIYEPQHCLSCFR